MIGYGHWVAAGVQFPSLYQPVVCNILYPKTKLDSLKTSGSHTMLSVTMILQTSFALLGHTPVTEPSRSHMLQCFLPAIMDAGDDRVVWDWVRNTDKANVSVILLSS